MKKLRELRGRTELSENCWINNNPIGPLGIHNPVDSTEVGLHDVANPESIDRINAFLGASSAKSVIDPWMVIKQIQKKLAMVGLSFTLPKMSKISWEPEVAYKSAVEVGSKPKPVSTGRPGNSARMVFPLSYLGGRYGVLDNMMTIGKDDNISHRTGHGISLLIDINKTIDGMSYVRCKIYNSNQLPDKTETIR